MHLSTSFIFLALISQNFLASAAPIELPEFSESLVSRNADSSDILEARDLLFESDDTREWDESDDFSIRELDDLELEVALRSLSDDDLLAVEARGLKGIAKLAKAAASPIKKLASAIRPSSSRKASSPAPAAKKPKKAASSKVPSSKKAGSKSPRGKSGKESSSKKGGSKSKKSSVASGKGAGSKGSGKKGAAKGKDSGKKASASGFKGGKSDKKGGKRKGKGKGGKSGGGGKKGGKKAGKKGTPPSRTRNRTFNVNLDPGTLLNAGAAITNVVTGLGN